MSSKFNNPLDIEDAIRKYKPGYLVPRIVMPAPDDEEAYQKSSNANRKIRVIALEGTHGVGKSTMCKVLRNLGYHVVEEDFIDVFSNFIVPGNDSHNCLVEIAWASMQIINVMNMANNIRREIVMDPSAHDVFFMDRCFMTGYVYGIMDEKTRKWYMRLFKKAIEDLKKDYNIEFEIVRLKALDPEEHFEHIQKRLEGDSTKVRKELHEAEREHFDRVEEAYTQLEWDNEFTSTFSVKFMETPVGDIIVPVGRFFASIGIEKEAEVYKDIDLLFQPLSGCLVGIQSASKE